jgi:hypothetical protein
VYYNHGSGFYEMVYRVAYDSWLRHGWDLVGVCYDMLYSVLYSMTHGRDMLGAAAADGLQCTMQLMVEA